MNLSEKDIAHIAQLARLELTQEEVKSYGSQITDILNYADKLVAVDDKSSQDMPVHGLVNVLREDNIKPSFTKDEVFKNAPLYENGYMKVQAVFSNDDN